MTATAEPAARAEAASTPEALDRAAGIELLGEVDGSGYRQGAALVRRADGQMVQLGPLMYALLDCVDGQRDNRELAACMSESLGRRFEEEHVAALAEKLAAQGLLAGSEQAAPPKPNPLLALRFKILVTNEQVTRRLTAPFAFLFRPWIVAPFLVLFAAVFWFVVVREGIAAATSQAFRTPELLLLVFSLVVASAGFHELGHAAACRYGGGKPGGMGMGLYMVWPAFYTDVTDAYRLPRRERLRVDLGGLYFNTIVSVATMAVWLVWRVDALLLLIALQLLQMVQQLSPVIRADGYHILADATGVPDLYMHIGPTLRRLLPWRRHEPSALTGRARLLVTAWVLVIVPVLLSLAVGAVLLLPRLVATAWESGTNIASAIPDDAGDGHVLGVLAALFRLFALVLPVLGCVVLVHGLLRMIKARATAWSDGRPVRRAVLAGAAAAAVAGCAWAWWPAGQYQPVRAEQNATLGGLAQAIAAPAAVVSPGPPPPAPAELAPGTHLAVAMIPEGGATEESPAIVVVPGADGEPAVVLVSEAFPDAGETQGEAVAEEPTETPSEPAATPAPTVPATSFRFELPEAPGPGGTQAVAVGTTDGGVTYEVAYALVTVRDGDPVTNTNSAFAFASCNACTTVAVSFQVVLVVGRSAVVAPINAAGALNVECPACVTTAIADQLVVTLSAEPSEELVRRLEAALAELETLPELGRSTAEVVEAVARVQEQVETELEESGLLAQPPTSTTPTTTTAGTSTTTTPATTTTATTTTATTPAATTTSPAATTTTDASSTTPSAPPPQPTTTAATTTTATTTTTTTTEQPPEDDGEPETPPSG